MAACSTLKIGIVPFFSFNHTETIVHLAHSLAFGKNLQRHREHPNASESLLSDFVPQRNECPERAKLDGVPSVGGFLALLSTLGET